MYIAYVDESGDGETPGKGSHTFTLGCVLVESSRWPDVFDGLLGFRRFLKTKHGILMRDEIKANYLLRSKGPLFQYGLSEPARHSIYRGFMRLHAKLGLLTFGVVIRKDVMASTGMTDDPRPIAWKYLIQRLERLTTKGPFDVGPATEVFLVHDEGYGPMVRALARKARRAGTAGSAFGGGYLQRPARLIIDDPVPRKSHESYFVQLADLAAYAAFRRLYPPGPRLVQIVPQNTWAELGAACYWPVNQNAGGVPGIVGWP